jgi:hypothetical protein
MLGNNAPLPTGEGGINARKQRTSPAGRGRPSEASLCPEWGRRVRELLLTCKTMQRPRLCPEWGGLRVGACPPS